MIHSKFYIIFDNDGVEKPEVYIDKPKPLELENYESLITVIFDENTRNVLKFIGTEELGFSFEKELLAIDYPLPPLIEDALKFLNKN